ncbi:MAG: hypothetical protein DF168_00975 [Candidatus Moanabacter tarae]|uniref:Uncharacterized protein n=1 Tax=Candidatus Moanibacter tarae TaxID=2200854 RepID=A0A2Z4ALG6_9BACT|nr:MAG: hypothetical protein DF168_00975 [Candidatus Moanabacter tarae]
MAALITYVMRVMSIPEVLCGFSAGRLTKKALFWVKFWPENVASTRCPVLQITDRDKWRVITFIFKSMV